MHKFFLPIIMASALCTAIAHAGILVPIPPVPGSIFTDVFGINDLNAIVGQYLTPDGVIHGFTGTLDGKYETFDYPGSSWTEGRGINKDGYVTGDSFDVQNNFYGPTFIRTPDGKIKPIEQDGLVLNGKAQGIIAHANLIGEQAVNDQGHLRFYGFYARGSNYRSELTLPFNTDRTRPRGLNTTGNVVVGYFHDLDDSSHFYRGFLLTNGIATAVDFPDQSTYDTYLEGVNRKGLIVGSWNNEDGSAGQAFLFDPARNRFRVIALPGTSPPAADGINNAGLVVAADETGSYLYCPNRKTCPLQGPISKQIPEHWVSAAMFSRTLPCRNNCLGPVQHTSLRHHRGTASTALF